METDVGFRKDEEIVIRGDKLYARKPLPLYGEKTFEVRLVMTKEAFIKCYKAWIKSEDEQ